MNVSQSSASHVNDAPPFDLVYEDKVLLLFNKPSGLLSVPGKGPEKADCLRTRVQQVYPEALTVHRLDMSTSGLLLMARNAEIHRTLSIAFANREVHKRYVAVVNGCVPNDDSDTNEDDVSTWRLIDLPIATDWINRPLMKIDKQDGKSSQTHYRVIKHDADNVCTHLELAPVTGRTHQLRLHLQAIGHSILGDHLYATDEVQAKSTRLMLHASRLTLMHPVTGRQMDWFLNNPFM
ncbi:MAG: RluA family pseudouridine synthase [Burkholderiaceae bacterium]|mgnify:CR=1 FL=1|jgi:tRNA pseudouridine32 synthase/23S rRNA pseudouridine746 synthase|nr:RluA family pseudouridine synthase [Polaromonas sp.]MBP6142257.1 RluA family pseudouridine synthase [Polaromonas sp.]MBP6155957.1 RluA family pseudouridine synthase [Polaromonas sp.]MBP7116222.1 RluA family pseudouridine synthase [Polaromonas sp.]MBP7308491.1 RluA family pseudouridine synthase [Polaromonas sp.]